MAIDEWYELDRHRAVLRCEPGQEPTLVGVEAGDQVCVEPVILLFDVVSHGGPER